MKHSSTWFALILIASALLLSAGRGACLSNDAHPNQSKKPTTKQNDSAQNQEQQVPISVLRAEQAAFDKAISAVEEQAEAAAKQADADHETVYSPSVLVQIGLLIVGSIYSVLAALQWAAINRQAEIVVMSERPWLMVVPMRYEIAPFNAPPTSRRSVTLFYKVINAGRSPAWLTGTRATVLKASSQSLSIEPEYPTDITTALTPKPPNEGFEESARRTFEPNEYADLCEGRIELVVYGVMTYQSALQHRGKFRRLLEWLRLRKSASEHMTRYCFCVAGVPNKGLAMTFCGPAAYNKYT